MSIDKPGSILIVILLSLGAGLFACVHSNQGFCRDGSSEMNARQAVFKTLGVHSLSLYAECASTRHMTEGLYGCLSDVPGGYCYYQSSDITRHPDAISKT